MKAFTIYQPYAYAIVAGLKQYETRPRRTNLRGRVAVHAGKRPANSGKPEELLAREIAYGKILEAKYSKGTGALKKATELAYGAVIGCVDIVDCVPVEEIADTLTERERLLGDFSPGRFAWVLKNPVQFGPFPCKGKQGWWEWPFVVMSMVGETPGKSDSLLGGGAAKIICGMDSDSEKDGENT